MTPRFVIVGASAAGVAAALALRESGFDGEVVLIGEEDQNPYERPAVSKEVLLTGAAPPIVSASAYEENRINLRTGVRVTRLNPRRGTVELEDGHELRADKVLLATGGRVRRLTIPGADLQNVHYARSIQDATSIRAGLVPGARVAVIGGGLIGAEVAASAVKAGCIVDWIEAGYRCLTRALSHPLDEVFMSIHQERGVRIHTNATVARILGERHASGIELADGRRIQTDLIVVGVGIVPAMELAQQAGIEVANGVVVDTHGMTSQPNVFSAGDVACHQTRYMAAPGRLEHWRHAQEHGVAAALSMLDQGKPYHELPWFWTDQYEHHVEGCGLPRADDRVVMRGDPASGAATAFYLRNDALVAASALNRPNDIRAAMRLISRGLTPEIDALQDLGCDLRKLEKEFSHAST